MSNRRRGASIGQFDVGDTQGSSISSAVVKNEVRAVHQRRRSEILRKDLDLTSGAQNASGVLDGQSGGAAVRRKIKRTKRKSYRYLAWLGPMLIVLAFNAIYYIWGQYDPNHWVNPYMRVSYNIPGTSLYGKGKRDWAFLGYHIIFFTFVREFCMQVALMPIAKGLGLRSKHKVNRFLEQAYSLIYYGITGPMGLYIMKYRCPELWYFNTTAFYENFPHRDIDLYAKAFYLLQAAFWGQQALVLMLHLEKRRKDFQELVFHHIVTVALIWLSYRFHFTHIGLAVYITMDVSDFFLALSKILNYLESSMVVFFFALFVFVWIYLRHYLNIVILYSVATEFRTVGPFELNWDTQQYKCWISQPITFGLLFLLQLVNLYWLALVLRIGWRYLKHNVKEDVRSEDEDEDEDI